MKERVGGYDKQYKEKAIPILAKIAIIKAIVFKMVGPSIKKKLC